jgi:hypothetical protein
MKVVGKRMKCQDLVFINMPMVQLIRANGKIIGIMGKVNTNFQTEQYTTVNGKII